MKSCEPPISLVTVCNDTFSVMLAVLIKSIELNHVTEEKINLYIVNDHIREVNLTKIKQSVQGQNVSISIIDIAEVIPKDISLPLDTSTFPLNVYVRIFIPSFLPKDVQKAIYLDVDMVFRKDISELWDIDLQEHVIAGVPDRSGIISSSWGGIKNYKELGLNGDWKYFNSGLLVMNLERWKGTNLSAEIINCINANKEFANFPDQYGLNVVFANKWLELDKRWNTYSPDIELNPFAIHFIGKKPIHRSFDGNKFYKQEFQKYLQLTPYKDFQELGDTKRLASKLYHKVHKRLLAYLHVLNKKN